MDKIQLNDTQLAVMNDFIAKYGKEAFIAALQNYSTAQQYYLFQTKSRVRKIPLCSINYIEIFGHNIVIHTSSENLTKYGTLKDEYHYVKTLNFVKCNQSILVPLEKIVEVRTKEVLISTGETFALSRSCARDIMNAYAPNRKKSKNT